MKYQFEKKYLYWGLTAFLVLAGSIIFYYFLFHGRNVTSGFRKFAAIMMPVIDGFILAYLLTPILNFIEHKVLMPIYRKTNIELNVKGKRRMRSIAILGTLVFFFIVIYTFVKLVAPQLINSIESIVYRFPFYANNLSNWVGNLLANNPDLENIVMNYLNEYATDLQKWLSGDLWPQVNSIIVNLSTRVVNFVLFFWNLLIGLIISVYVMGSKELFAAQSKKVLYATLNENTANSIIDEFRFIHRTFGGFITGKLLDSLIIGIICFIITNMIGTPYAVLVSVIVGVTNVIPFFGPYLGAIPSAFLILLVDPKQCLYFVIFIVILQQFDGNILGPKILGDSTGLSSFWVIFSITIFGGLFGIPGMFIGVPVFAVIYAGLRRKIDNMLRKKDLPDSTKDYLKLRHIHNHELQIQENPSESLKNTENVSEKKLFRADSTGVEEKSNHKKKEEK
ncbi:MAG: AI-2E family transporter [Lachnospiraceae bacterium]|nr:AI-2E family transporter [Lachnospiraceae bacterium]